MGAGEGKRRGTRVMSSPAMRRTLGADAVLLRLARPGGGLNEPQADRRVDVAQLHASYPQLKVARSAADARAHPHQLVEAAGAYRRCRARHRPSIASACARARALPRRPPSPAPRVLTGVENHTPHAGCGGLARVEGHRALQQQRPAGPCIAAEHREAQGLTALRHVAQGRPAATAAPVPAATIIFVLPRVVAHRDGRLYCAVRRGGKLGRTCQAARTFTSEASMAGARPRPGNSSNTKRRARDGAGPCDPGWW